MLASELISDFRSDTRDTVEPYLWTEEDALRYASEAQLSYFRFIGGVPDATSEACEISVVEGEEWVDLHPSVLNIRIARLDSDKRPLRIINAQDDIAVDADYGTIFNTPLTGRVVALVLGESRGKARLVNIPEADDTVRLTVYRLPLQMHLTSEGDVLEVDDMHREGLLYRMKELAYAKQDADAYDPQASKENGAKFENYCRTSRREQERLKSKPVRSVSYGGI